MRTQTRLLAVALIGVASLAVWSQYGFSFGRFPAPKFIPVGATPCPEGFAPPSRVLLLPDVPEGKTLPALPDPLPQCVLLVERAPH